MLNSLGTNALQYAWHILGFFFRFNSLSSLSLACWQRWGGKISNAPGGTQEKAVSCNHPPPYIVTFMMPVWRNYTETFGRPLNTTSSFQTCEKLQVLFKAHTKPLENWRDQSLVLWPKTKCAVKLEFIRASSSSPHNTLILGGNLSILLRAAFYSTGTRRQREQDYQWSYWLPFGAR